MPKVFKYATKNRVIPQGFKINSFMEAVWAAQTVLQITWAKKKVIIWFMVHNTNVRNFSTEETLGRKPQLFERGNWKEDCLFKSNICSYYLMLCREQGRTGCCACIQTCDLYWLYKMQDNMNIWSLYLKQSRIWCHKHEHIWQPMIIDQYTFSI